MKPKPKQSARPPEGAPRTGQGGPRAGQRGRPQGFPRNLPVPTRKFVDYGPTSPVQVALAQPSSPVAASPAAPATPAAGGINPYTGKPLGPNEYVGVAGSEAEHPGMVRIPPPGWWDPSNPNYERRSYYRDASGNVVAREAGFFDPSHPYNTGRESERNSEYESRPGIEDVQMSQPGMPTWGPGQKRPTPSVGSSDGRTHLARNPLLELLTGTRHAVDVGGIRGGLFGPSAPVHPVGVDAITTGLLGQPESIPQSLLDYIRSLMAGQRGVAGAS